jgi:hypothetical protein
VTIASTCQRSQPIREPAITAADWKRFKAVGDACAKYCNQKKYGLEYSPSEGYEDVPSNHWLDSHQAAAFFNSCRRHHQGLMLAFVIFLMKTLVTEVAVETLSGRQEAAGCKYRRRRIAMLAVLVVRLLVIMLALSRWLALSGRFAVSERLATSRSQSDQEDPG